MISTNLTSPYITGIFFEQRNAVYICFVQRVTACLSVSDTGSRWISIECGKYPPNTLHVLYCITTVCHGK